MEKGQSVFTFILTVPQMYPAYSSYLLMISKLTCLYQILRSRVKQSEVISRLIKKE